MFLVDWFYGVLALLGLWQKEAKIILFLGLDNTRKTTLLRMLMDERLDQPTQHPTSGELIIGKIKFKVFVLGGRQIARRVLTDYYAKVGAVVYLVNTYDEERFDESKRGLDALLADELLASVPFLILGELIDNIEYHHYVYLKDPFCELPPYAFCEESLVCRLGLSNLTTGKGIVDLSRTNVRPLEIFRFSIVPKMGQDEGFKWLSQY